MVLVPTKIFSSHRDLNVYQTDEGENADDDGECNYMDGTKVTDSTAG